MKTVKFSFTKSVRNIVAAIVVLLACVAVATLVGSRATEAHAADLESIDRASPHRPPHSQ